MISLFRASLVGLAFGFTFSVGHANPDGAPWGGTDPNAAQNCASCHFDEEPIIDSPAISLEGLPENLTPGGAYVIILVFNGNEDSKSGFMITASAGIFGPTDETLEASGSQIRSLEPKSGSGKTSWQFLWISPDAPAAEISFQVAVNAGNGDQSSFGDEIHFKSFTVAVE